MYKPFYVDTDSIKVERQFQELLEPYYQRATKDILNSTYGFMTGNQKENKDMNKNYIVVHDTYNGLGIVFKDKIGGVFKDSEDGTARLLVVDGYMLGTKDKYEDIIKQIV